MHVVVSLASGGLERLVVRWVRERNCRRPKSSSVCCLDEAGALAAELPAEVVTVLGARRSRFPWDRNAVRRLRMCAVERGASILHSHNLAAQQYAVLAAGGTRLRVVHTEHGSRPPPSGVVDRLREWYLARRTDRTVVVSSSVVAAGGSRATVIPNGVSPHVRAGAEDRAALRRELGLADGCAVIGYVGRLAGIKGVDRLLWAFGRMAADGDSNAVLLIVGDGPERDKLIEQAARAGVEERVVFAGFRSDARRLYDLMDCFVLPSRSEGLPVALLEAMSAGVPALATDVGSCRDVLMGGEAGVILPADCGQWPSLLRRTLERAGESRGMATKAIGHVLRHYSEDVTAETYERVYAEVVLSA